MTQTPLMQVGVLNTEHGSKYLQQLCKHFGHKVEVSYTTEKGTAALPPGEATLLASSSELRVTVTGANEDALRRARHTIDSHLKTFAFREGFEHMDWGEPSAAPLT